LSLPADHLLLSPVAFTYPRTIHFSDTDAAGVVFFARALAICHEAYEESLSAAGLELHAFFSAKGVIVPIGKAEAEYLRPLAVGDKVRVAVVPAPLTENSYEVRFEIVKLGPVEKPAARVRTEHVCLDAASRKRTPVPPDLAAWVRG
jgi:1,4-dihydroxy-2-naphthoyl-CoA hydrolase